MYDVYEIVQLKEMQAMKLVKKGIIIRMLSKIQVRMF